MNTYQNRYSQMKAKLEEGLKLLSESSESDGYKLGVALIKLHGAMEDFVRIEVAKKAPHLREVVEDARETNWKKLLEYGRTYLGFTEKDCQIITDANLQRQAVAHGGNYEKSPENLKKYSSFVKGWVDQGQAPASDVWDEPRYVEPRRTYQPAQHPAYQVPPPMVQNERVYQAPRGRRWYRSKLFLFFAFFLLPPIWAILILTDRRPGCIVKGFAFLMLVLEIAFARYIIYPNLDSYVNGVQNFFRPLDIQPSSELPPLGIPTSTLSNILPGTIPTDAPANPNLACVIIWAEYPMDDLGGKNRSMVWEDIIKEQVDGSGMTASQFYDLVVEQNPHLVTDGYEFRKGKTYLLPKCQ